MAGPFYAHSDELVRKGQMAVEKSITDEFVIFIQMFHDFKSD